jgi:[pyruvate, water dikinase]-phosphate phosphotransferase / [pyruvate, water dikinase] kinase
VDSQRGCDNCPRYPQGSREASNAIAICGELAGFPKCGFSGAARRSPVPSYQQTVKSNVENRKNFFHLHLISDSTGETLISAGRAAAAQFQGNYALEHVYPLIRNRKQLASVLEAVDKEPGIVLYTIVDQELASVIDLRCREMAVPCVNVLEPVIDVFQAYLGAPSRRRVGAQHALNADYFARIEALNFAMDHDDGQMPETYDEADVILIGISRTSKTPTSIYLANRGIKTANIPIVPGVDLPEALYRASRPLIVGLIATTDRISQVRENRELGNSNGFDRHTYIDRASINEELKYARSLCARNNWPIIDVTRRSIEETAAAILALRPRLR